MILGSATMHQGNLDACTEKDKEHLTLVEVITKPLSVEMTHLDFSKLEELDEEVFVTNEKLEN